MPWKELLGLGSGLINGIITDHYNQQNASRNQDYWEKQLALTYQANEKAADNAMKRSINLYNLTQSPESMVKQLKKAGLNPALMYSNGGMGGQTQSGPQGSVSGAEGAPSPLGLQNYIDPLTMAKIKNIDADTDKKEEETKNISQDTKTKQAEEEYTKAQTLWTQIRSNIDNNNLTISNATIQEQITEIKTKTQSAIEELEMQKRENKINEETYETKIKQIKQDYANSVSQGLIMEQEIEKLKAVTENTKWDTKQKQEEIKKIKWECKVMQQEVSNLINDTNLKHVQALTEKEQQKYLQTLQENIVKEFEAKYGWTLTKEDAFRMGESIIDAISTICSITPSSAIVGALGKSMPKIGFQ